jgi:pSer/pThr/pTyr-binding forkhead associated (FHA) protein
MEDRTLMVEPEEAERTQMVGSAECPVCHEQNVAGTVWCAECGFRLEMAPGEMTAPAQSFALVGGGQRYPLKSGENVVGRLNADVFLSDPSASRRHAVVTVDDDGIAVRDEGSSNGTRVGGMRIEPGTDVPLAPGQAVQFGAVSLSLEAPEGVEFSVPPAPPLPADAALETEEAVSEAAVTVAPVAPAVAILTNGVDTYTLHEGSNTVGRRAENDVAIPDPAVSGRHAVITIENGIARIADSGSTNGTFLTDQRLISGAEETVPPGAVLRFGRVVLNYEVIPPESGLNVPEAEEAQVAEDSMDEASPAGFEEENSA